MATNIIPKAEPTEASATVKEEDKEYDNDDIDFEEDDKSQLGTTVPSGSRAAKEEDTGIDVKSDVDEELKDDHDYVLPKGEAKDEGQGALKDEDGFPLSQDGVVSHGVAAETRLAIPKDEHLAQPLDDDADQEAAEPDYSELSPRSRQIEQILDMLFEKPNRSKKLRKRRAELSAEDQKELQAELADLEGRGGPAMEPRSESEEDLEAEEEDGRPAKRRRTQLTGLSRDEQEAYQFFHSDEDDDYDVEGAEEEHRGEQALHEILDPAIAEQNYMTTRDDDIREKDVPERLYIMQLRERRTKFSTMRSDPEQQARLTAEAKYIFNHPSKYFQRLLEKHKEWKMDFALQDGAEIHYQTAIKAVLAFLHYDNYEVPFICRYRKENTAPLQVAVLADGSLDRTHDCEDLWFIYNRDIEFWRLQHQYFKLKDMWKEIVQGELFANDAYRDEWYFYEMYYEKQLQCSQDYTDFMEWLLLFSTNTEVDDESRKRRGAVGRNQYRIAVQNKLDEFVRRNRGFGMTPFECAERIDSPDEDIRRATDMQIRPLDAMAEYVCDKFPTPYSALRGCQYVMAMQISHDPRVLRTVRDTYEEHGEIIIEATSKGKRSGFMQGTDNFLVKDAHNTPDILRFLEAHDKDLCKLQVRLEPRVLDTVLRFDEWFKSDRYDALAQEWNEVRAEIACMVREEVTKKTQAAILSILTEEAKEEVMRLCAMSLRDMAIAPPYCATEELNSTDPSTGKTVRSIREADDGYLPGQYRVLSCVYESDKNNIEFVQLDGNGEVLGHLTWPPLAERTEEGRHQKMVQENKLMEFICRHKPLVIALGAGSFSCRRFYNYLLSYVKDLASSESPNTPDAIIPIEWVPEDIARVYAGSSRGRLEFPDFTDAQRRAVSVGRRLRDPLPEVAALFNAEKDILSLKLHEFQDCLPQDDLLERLEQFLVSVVCQVGVPLNQALQHKHLQGLLPFVCGLGPRKAAALIDCIQKSGADLVLSREALLNEYGLTQRVWHNCAGFLRVAAPDDNFRQRDGFDPLDGTRIHPESYEIALKLAIDAKDEQVNSDMSKEYRNQVIQSIMDDPNRWRPNLDELDLEQYAKFLEVKGRFQREESMEDIKKELLQPFEEPRTLFTSMNADDLFHYLTGEDDKTLAKGTMVMATFQELKHSGTLVLRLSNGVTGLIINKSFTQEQKEMAQRLRRGDPVPCVVSHVARDRFIAFLELKKAGDDARIEAMRLHALSQSPSTGSGHSHRVKSKYYSRQVNHRCWKDITREEAMRLLQEGQWADPIVRPSSLKPDSVTITFVLFHVPGEVSTPAFYHLDLAEAAAQDGTVWLAGQKAEFVFNDLDEVISVYVSQFIELAEEITHHEKFVFESQEGVSALLVDLFNTDRNRIHYRIIPELSAQKSACFQIYFIDKSSSDPQQPYKIKHLPVSLSFNGFTLRSVKETNRFRGPHKGVRQLLDAFKGFYLDFKTKGPTQHQPQTPQWSFPNGALW